MPQLLTHSRIESFKVCRRKHWFAYEIAIRRTLDAKALRMGSAFHAGLECLQKGLDCAVGAIVHHYEHCPETIDLYDWQMECETVVRMACGYSWRWGEQRLERVATERSFRLPLCNPDTDKPTPNFDFAGKIDGIVRLEDGRLAVLEHKLQSESLDTDSPLWARLRIDTQVSLYMLAARELGYDVSTVLYDVARKPTIRPADIPLLDSEGLKIVTDRNNIRVFTRAGKPRQTGDSKQGYTLQSRRTTPDEWGERLNEDIGERPDFYFARVEVPRLDDELDECRQELWDLQKALRDAQRNGRWYRTCNRDTCAWCSYFDLCSTKFNPARDLVPDGYEYVQDVHPELTGETDGETASTPHTCEAAAGK